MFEVVLIFIVAAAVIAVAAVWLFFWIVAKLVRAALWGLSLPARAARSDGEKPTLLLSRATPVERRCANGKCAAEMPAEARFCGRCGSAVTTDTLLHEPRPDATYVVKKKLAKKIRKGKLCIVDGVITRPTVVPPRRCKVSRVA